MNFHNLKSELIAFRVNLLAVIAVIVALAAVPPHAHAELGVEPAHNIENLSNNSILSIFQDKHGYIWVGSYDGLNRYDGKRVDVFRFELNTTEGLSGNIISEIYEADNDCLWVLTSMGLDKFSTETLKAVEHYPEIRGDRHLIASDIEGHTFLLHPDGTLACYKASTGKFLPLRIPGLPRDCGFSTMIVDENCTLWLFTTGNDILKVHFTVDGNGDLDPRQMQWEHVSIHDVPPRCIMGDSSGFWLVDSEGQLLHYDTKAHYKTHIADLKNEVAAYGNVSGLARIENDIILAFSGTGLGRVIASEENRFELMSNEVGVFRVIRDRRQPLVWCATDGRGIYKVYDIHTRYNTIRSTQIPFLTKPIRSFHTDADNNLWIGTKGDGLFVIGNYSAQGHGRAIRPEEMRHFGQSDGLPDNQVFSIKESAFHPGRIWIATRGPGISYVQMPQARIVTLPHPTVESVHDIFEQNDSVLWLASTTAGLLRAVVDDDASGGRVKSVEVFKFTKGAQVCEELYSMAFDGDSSLYIGCRGGLGIVRFNILSRTYDFIDNVTDRIPAIGDVICLAYGSDSILYFGSSAGAGILDCHDGANPSLLRVLTRRDGMVNDMVHSILPDGNGNVWISTNKGLVRFNLQSDVVHNITGLNGDIREFCDNSGYLSPHNGDIVFGALNGIVWVSSEKGAAKHGALPPLFYFNSLIINGLKRDIGDYISSSGELDLSSSKNSISLSFAALDYINGDDINYYYLLEGYNDQWVNLGTEPTVTFTNLPPGHYTLRVRYQGDAFDASEAEHVLGINVRAPWYATKWAYMGAGVLLLLLVSGGIVQSRRIYQRKRREMEKRLRSQQQQQLYADRTEFFTNITHELCSPLTMILGLCNILRKDLNETERKKLDRYIDSLQLHSRHLNELVQEILDFRKMEEGGFRNIRVQPVKMEYAFDRWVNSYSEIARDNEITFRTSVNPPDLKWNTDISCLGKIITNLTSNAFKYTPVKGEIDISVTTDGNDYLLLSVYNTGAGISPDDQKDLFNRYKVFHNVDHNGYRDMASRHGLGLFICHELVERLGGEVEVESRENEYTRFTVRLPRLEVTRQALSPGAGAVQPHGDTFSTAGRPEILVVDDNPDILWLVSDILSDHYNVVGAGNAADAFAVINHKVPSLIITDLMMPDTDGIEFILKLRAHKFAKTLPILILTAKVSEKDKIMGYNIGADAYLTKPFTPEFLKVVVERLLQRKKSDKDYYRSSESAVTLQDGVEISNEEKEFFDRLKQIIADNIEDESKLRPADLAREVGVDVRTLYRKFKKYTPYTPNEFVKNYRYAYAARLLLTTNLTIQEIIYRVGLTNKTVFYADFKKAYGMTPKEYRDGGGQQASGTPEPGDDSTDE